MTFIHIQNSFHLYYLLFVYTKSIHIRLLHLPGTCQVNQKKMLRYNPENVAATLKFLEHLRELLLLLEKDAADKNKQLSLQGKPETVVPYTMNDVLIITLYKDQDRFYKNEFMRLLAKGISVSQHSTIDNRWVLGCRSMASHH